MSDRTDGAGAEPDAVADDEAGDTDTRDRVADTTAAPEVTAREKGVTRVHRLCCIVLSSFLNLWIFAKK